MKSFSFHRLFSMLGKNAKNPEGKIKNEKNHPNSEIATLTEGTPKLPFSYENLTSNNFSGFFSLHFCLNLHRKSRHKWRQ